MKPPLCPSNKKNLKKGKAIKITTKK